MFLWYHVGNLSFTASLIVPCSPKIIEFFGLCIMKTASIMDCICKTLHVCIHFDQYLSQVFPFIAQNKVTYQLYTTNPANQMPTNFGGFDDDFLKRYGGGEDGGEWVVAAAAKETKLNDTNDYSLASTSTTTRP